MVFLLLFLFPFLNTGGNHLCNMFRRKFPAVGAFRCGRPCRRDPMHPTELCVAASEWRASAQLLETATEKRCSYGAKGSSQGSLKLF